MEKNSNFWKIFFKYFWTVPEGFKDSKRFENPEKFKIIAWKPNRYKINFENMYLKCSRRFSKILIFSRKNRNISKIESKTEISRKSNRKQKYLENRIENRNISKLESQKF